jgi:hypothetical protein
MEPKRICIEELKRRLDAGEHITILDTRGDDAWKKADAQIPASRRVPPDAVEEYLDEVPDDDLIVTYCT